MKFVKPFGGIAAALVLAFLASCSESPSLVGKWIEVGGSETVEFSPDTAITATSGSIQIKGSYRLAGADSVDVDFGQLGKVRMSVAFSGDTLVLTRPGDDADRYVRAAP